MNELNTQIKAITIENFKSIGCASRIDISPITLLFGPNSAGKSTVFAAMEYMKSVLESNQTQVSEDWFSSFVHRHDTNKKIRIRLDLEVEELESSLREVPCGHKDAPHIEDSFDSGPIWVECIVRECKPSLVANAFPAVAEYAIGLDNQEFLRCRLSEELPSCHSNTELVPNWKHPLFRDIKKTIAPLNDLSSVPRDGWRFGYFDNDGTNLVQFGQDEAGELRVEGITIESCVPNPRRILTATVGLYEEHPGFETLAPMVSLMFVQALYEVRELASNALENICHIGPFRHPPPQGPLTGKLIGDWYSGLAAWECLASEPWNREYGNTINDGENEYPLVAAAGNALSEMNTGFSLRPRRYSLVNTTDTLIPFLEDEASDEGVFAVLKKALQMMESAPQSHHTLLYDLVQECEIHPENAASGIVQLVPVIVALLLLKSGTYVIEQPELHLHPGVQCELGEFLANCMRDANGQAAIIETHSEHLLLRLQKLIRTGRLSTDMLSVSYFQRHKSGSIVTPLQISEEGEFLDEWPEGFFEEGFNEVFGE
jgi:predicted ATPase